MTNEIVKPLNCTDEHLEYLNDLRESGVTNMLGAAPYLYYTFDELSKKDILIYWMKTFNPK